MSYVCKRGYKCMCFQCGEKDCEYFKSEPPKWVKDLFENEEIKEKLKIISESKQAEEQEENRMNHECTHCIDFSEFCPQSCELAKLSRDLKNISDGYVSISYAHFLRSCMCPFGTVAGNAMRSIITNLMRGDEE